MECVASQKTRLVHIYMEKLGSMNETGMGFMYVSLKFLFQMQSSIAALTIKCNGASCAVAVVGLIER